MTTQAAFELCLAVLLLWCASYAIYLNFFRRVLHTRFRFQIKEIKDELSILLLAEKIQPDDEAYQILKYRLQKAERTIGSFNLTNILLAFSRGDTRPTNLVVAEDGKIRDASVELRVLSEKLNLAVVGMLATNSPFFLGILVVTISGLALWWMVARVARARLTEKFWDAIYIDNLRKQQMAFRSQKVPACIAA